MFKLAICEIFNRHIHGHTQHSSPGIDEHILINDEVTSDEFMNNEWMESINMLRDAWQTIPYNLKQHPTIRNYQHIVSGPNYYKVDIIEMIELSGGEQIAIIKTGGLKTIQRRWRNWMNNH